jgi:hypothetical protein
LVEDQHTRPDEDNHILAVLDRHQEGSDLRIKGQLTDRTSDRLVVHPLRSELQL